MLFLAFVFRLLFINATGYTSDVSTFESWALTLAHNPTQDFFAKAGFADYPPGYFFILWFVGHIEQLLVSSDPSYFWIKVAVKLPAIVMDIVDSLLVYKIVMRFAGPGTAFVGAMLFAFNPAMIFVSAYYGQVESVSAGVTIASVLLLMIASDKTGREAQWYIMAAWLAISYSILIKPPALVIVPLFIAFIFTGPDAETRLTRLKGTGMGLGAGFVLAYLAAVAFHAGWNPIQQFVWLFGRYTYGSGVYAYNSVNAFNLYTMLHGAWQSDAEVVPNFQLFGVTLGLPQYAWGILLFVAAAALIVSRYVQKKDNGTLLEAAMLLSLAFFILSTRMHERYIYNALAFCIPLAVLHKRYFYAAIALTITLFANLWYALDYLYVMDTKVQGVDATDLVPVLMHPASILNVLVFFALGYVYLGASGLVSASPGGAGTVGAGAARGLSGLLAFSKARTWFRPLEGLSRMTRLDWGIASLLTLASFVLSYVAYTWPAEKIFDEIYYARAGEEYLQHKEIFEFTHPPLTKLIVTLSMMLFGGLHGGGDSPAGWRFLNLVLGAVMVLIMYCFAKRVLGSTAFATVGASLLLLDGFHFAQSRIATPEIGVATFTLLTLYCFYRYWIAAQVRVAPTDTPPLIKVQSAYLGVGAVLALILALIVPHDSSDRVAVLIAFLYFSAGIYAAVRLIVPWRHGAKEEVSFAEGSLYRDGTIETFDGGQAPVKGALVPGETTRAGGGGLIYENDDLRVEYARGGSLSYATPEGTALFAPRGTLSAGEAKIDGRRDGMLWMVLTGLSMGCLAASKWNGLFDIPVMLAIMVTVWSQRFWEPVLAWFGKTEAPFPALFGNPRGFPLDIAIALMGFIVATVYWLAYLPYFQLGHNLTDLIALQQQMFGYHYDLRATHPYSSEWWQWPLLQVPISYYYHDFRIGAAASDATACCVADIVAIPNPVNWWTGLVTVPLIAVLAWRERNKAYTLLVTAYLLQWLPWMLSPRLAFEYHFFPNLAIICMANAAILQRIWNAKSGIRSGDVPWTKVFVGAFLASVVAAFIFFYPVVSGQKVTWNQWHDRMLTQIEGNNWILPHPNR